jgi:dimethylargininase
MTVALTNAVSPHLWQLYPAIDPESARRQHDAYCDWLRRNGADVRRLTINPEHGDACFIEDNAIVVDEIAIVTTMGTAHRRAEPAALAPVLEEYRPVTHLSPDASIEGGDVLRIGREIFVGRSVRTNQQGIDELRRVLEPLGYHVTAVDVLGGLHLKTACTALDSSTLLANPEWVDLERLKDRDVIAVDPREPAAANVLHVGNETLMQASCPRTIERVRGRFPHVQSIDMSEFEKADGGLTCLSVVFDR